MFLKTIIKKGEILHSKPHLIYLTITFSTIIYLSAFYFIYKATNVESTMILGFVPILISAWLHKKILPITVLVNLFLTLIIIFTTPIDSESIVPKLIISAISFSFLGILIGVLGNIFHMVTCSQSDVDQIAMVMGDRDLKHKILLDMIPDMVYKIDRKGYFIYVNNSVTNLGFTRSELLGVHFSKIIHPDDIEMVSRKAVLPNFIGKVTGDKGSPKLFDERRGGKRMTRGLEIRLIGKNWKRDKTKIILGDLISYGEVTAVGEYSDNGNDGSSDFVGTVGIVRDISGRKKAEEELKLYRTQLEKVIKDRTDELQKTNDELRQSQKMEAIGLLAGGIAHDFNNMLSSILGYADLIRRKYKDTDPKLTKWAGSIVDVSKNAAELTGKLLAFARKGKFEISTIDMHRVIHDTINILEHTIDKNIIISKQLNADTPTVKGDTTQLQNVVLNLAVNARDAMPDGGKLIFATDVVDITKKYISTHHYHIKPGLYLLTTVTDTGIGMSKEIKKHIFEPFYTTKPLGKGTGLGLASVYGTVKNHNGSIEVYSEENRGTVFKMYIPLANNSIVKQRSKTVVLKRGTGRILVVDDEPLVRDVAKEILSELGYEIAFCSDGLEGVNYYKEHKGEIDLTILDLIMPNMGGHDCFVEIRKINPEAKVIIASGYALNDDAKKIIDKGALVFLQKPFDLTRLSDAVSDAIGIIK